jgi:uncharacterized membrane protein
MKEQKNTFPFRVVFNAIAILSLIAVLLSVYVFWTTKRGQALAGCGEGSGCEEVLQTEWSSVAGIPVSLAGALVYAAIFITALKVRNQQTLLRCRALLFLSALAAGSALWFLGLQLFLIHSLCYFCLGIHLCGLSILGLTVWSIIKNKSEKHMKPKENVAGISFKRVAPSGLIGLGGAVLFAVVQILFRGNAVPAEPVNPSPPPQIAQTEEAPQDQEVKKREVSFMNGNISVQLGDYPVIGSPEAPKIIGLFLDYTCPACRSLHPQISKMVNESADQFAVVVLPMPLDANCNPPIGQTSYQHRDACNYWLTALALWHVSPEAFHNWDEYMFQTEYPPPLEDARKYAGSLIGADALNALQSDPQNSDLIRYSIQMFHSPLFTKKFLPTLLTSQRYYSGTPSPEELQQLVKE